MEDRNISQASGARTPFSGGGRQRELRKLLLSAADAARSSRRTAMNAHGALQERTRAIRDRLASFFATTI
jgi:hypothetical protein